MDGDDRISRAEFNIYVKEYLSNYPGLKPEDYPRFEDFDHDNGRFKVGKDCERSTMLYACSGLVLVFNDVTIYLLRPCSIFTTNSHQLIFESTKTICRCCTLA